jgi:hypothetical protein
MSPKFLSHMLGLSALGVSLSWLATTLAADGPDAPTPASTPAPAPNHSVLLMTNGRILEGELSQDDAGYVLKQRLGTIRFPKRTVERVFHSLREVYEYKLSLIAQGDPDEHLKLAQWCLSVKLYDEARAQLEALLRVSPGHPEAKAMLANMDAARERAERRHDAEIVRAKAELDGKDVPGELNPEDLRGPKRGAKPSAMSVPVIFDLPPALAVRRTQEFAKFIHPILQKHCAKCHNENFAGTFQLIQAKTRAELADPMIIRTNLEATLRLVDTDNLSQSPLLTNSLLPHKPKNLPILSTKSLAYRDLSLWVKSLQVKPHPGGESSKLVGPSQFGIDRPDVEPPDSSHATAQAPKPQAAHPQPPRSQQELMDRLAKGEDLKPQNIPYDPHFPTTPMVGGPNEPPPSFSKARPKAAVPAPAVIPGSDKNLPPRPSSPPAPPKPESTNPSNATNSEATAAQVKNRKPKAIDPNALEKYLSNRNGNR